MTIAAPTAITPVSRTRNAKPRRKAPSRKMKSSAKSDAAIGANRAATSHSTIESELPADPGRSPATRTALMPRSSTIEPSGSPFPVCTSRA